MTTISGVSLSASAARRINAIAKEKAGSTLLRIAVLGGGCSGFSYRFDLIGEAEAEADDVIVERDGAKIVIDSASLPFLSGSEVDFHEELIGASFKVRNPNALSSCGCGVSFSV